MLTQIILQTSNPMTLNVSDVSENDILILTRVSGLSPADITLFTGDFARDGGYYQGRRATQRNPVFSFKINPDYKNDIRVSDIREMLYKQFYEPQPLTDQVQVLLKDDRKPDRYFIGYTEKLDTESFEKDQKAVVSMLCVDPYLRSANQVTVNDAGLVSTVIAYDGSADTGIQLSLKVATACASLNINLAGQTMTLTGPFAVNDVVTINTNIGSRSIKKNGVDIMAAMTAASKWVGLNGATQTLAVDGGVAGDGKVVTTQYIYRSAWWGI